MIKSLILQADLKVRFPRESIPIGCCQGRFTVKSYAASIDIIPSIVVSQQVVIPPRAIVLSLLVQQIRVLDRKKGERKVEETVKQCPQWISRGSSSCQ